MGTYAAGVPTCLVAAQGSQEVELEADEIDIEQQDKGQHAEKVKHSLLSRMWRQLSVWMTTGRPSKEVLTA